jgi:hypothetical protein
MEAPILKKMVYYLTTAGFQVFHMGSKVEGYFEFYEATKTN